MPPVKGQMFRYSEADMEAAIQECKRGVPTSTAAKKFGVPRVTLLNKVKGKTPMKRKMGRTCYISDDTEALLVKWAKAMVKQGFPIGKENLQDSVKKIVDDLNLETPFKDGRPGKRWYSSFLKRHPDLTPRQPQNLTSSRALVTTSQLKNWFKEVSTYLEENNYANILVEPHRIFNMDETAFFLNPKGNKVLAAKGEKSVYQQVNSDEKECFTVLLGGNAAGQVLPPMVIFKYLRIPKELSLSVPVTWGIGRSDSGWMTMETFYEYICNIFNKWLNDNGIQKPVILFMDGHTSHMSFHVSKFCSENGIILIALFPNATHLLQPMDVAIFRSLKGAWKTAVQSWRLEHIDSPILRKIHFCPLLNKVLKDTLSPEMFQNGFRKCGLSPWNPDEVCCASEQPTDEFMALQKMAKIKELEMGLKFLDKYIASEKIDANIGLFQFYKKIEDLLTKTKEVLPSTENLSTLNNSTSEQGSTTQILPPLNTVPSSDPLTMPSTPQATTLDFPSQYLPLSEDPKTPCKEVQESNTQNLESTIITGSLIEPPISSHYRPQESCSKNSDNMAIPSPFKRALFWPTPKQNSKGRRKEKVPSVVSSLEWQRYHENKEKKKTELEVEKKSRAEERKRKKEETEKARKLKTDKKLVKKSIIKNIIKNKFKKTDYNSSTTEEEWVESGDSADDISDEVADEENKEERNEEERNKEERNEEESRIKQGDYVIVKFPGKKRYYKYVCIVQKVTKTEIEVMAMIACDNSKTVFKENDRDISAITESQIIKVLDVPNMIITGDRIKYKFDSSLEVDG